MCRRKEFLSRFDESIDDRPSHVALKNSDFFPTDRDPALNDLATCWMRNGEWLSVVKWFGRARGREYGGGGGPHLLQSSNGKVIEQVVAPHRGQRQIRFHRNPPFPSLTHNSNEHGDPSVKINVLYLCELTRHQHSFPRKYSHCDVSIMKLAATLKIFPWKRQFIKLVLNKLFSFRNKFYTQFIIISTVYYSIHIYSLFEFSYLLSEFFNICDLDNKKIYIA